MPLRCIQASEMRVDVAHRRREERPRRDPGSSEYASQQPATLAIDLAGLRREHHDPRYTL